MSAREGSIAAFGRRCHCYFAASVHFKGKARSAFYAAKSERREGMEIARGVGARAGASAFVVDRGAYAKTLKLPLKRFTLVGATTRAGMLSAPLRDRFGIVHHLEYYEPAELQRIVERSARVLDIAMEEAGARTIAARSRGTPRIANRLLRNPPQAQ